MRLTFLKPTLAVDGPEGGIVHNFNLKLLCYWAAGSLLIDSSRLSAQGPCTVGVNQPAKVLESGNYKAFPKSGVRVWQGAWLTNSNGIR